MNHDTLKYLAEKVKKGQKLADTLDNLNKYIKMFEESDKLLLEVCFRRNGQYDSYQLHSVIGDTQKTYQILRVAILEKLREYRDQLQAEFDAL